MSIETMRYFRAACVVFALSAVCSTARETVPYDSPTVTPKSASLPEIPEASPQSVVVAPSLAMDFATSDSVAVSSVSAANPVEIPVVEVPDVLAGMAESSVSVEVQRVFPADKIDVIRFDEKMFWFWPVDKAHASGLRVPVISPQVIEDVARVVVPSIWEIPFAVGCAVGVDFSATRMETIEINGIPVISIIPENLAEKTAIPIAVAFPVATEAGEPMVCVVYRVADRYEHIIVVVSDIHVASPVVGLGRFVRYGSFQYPSVMWKLQDMGAKAEERGDAASADLIYAEFLKAFDEYVRRMED